VPAGPEQLRLAEPGAVTGLGPMEQLNPFAGETVQVRVTDPAKLASEPMLMVVVVSVFMNVVTDDCVGLIVKSCELNVAV